MAFIIGVTRLGKSDRVPGLFHVRTSFLHVNFVPLVPTGSVLISERIDLTHSHEVSIPLSLRSVLLGYLRALSIVAAFIVGIALLVTMLERGRWNPLSDLRHVLIVSAIGLAIIGATVWLWQVPRASLRRARDLGSRFGLPPAFVEAHWERNLRRRKPSRDMAADPRDTEDCPQCQGRGKIDQMGTDNDGLPWCREVPCPACRATAI
jgi:hypothetical protein